MTSSRERATGMVGLLIGLLALAQVHAGLGVSGTVWRATVLSWDDPVTQIVDELACQSVPHTDPWRDARDHALHRHRPSGWVATAAPEPVRRLTLPSPLTRSPPAP
jgi:hypothetical protein